MNNFERFIIGDCTIIRHTNFTFRAVFGRDKDNTVSTTVSIYGTRSCIFKDRDIDLWEAAKADPNGISASGYPNYVAYPNTDWWDEIYTKQWMQKHTISLNGKEKKTGYSMSFSYIDNPGIMKNTGYNRYMGRVNLYSDITDWLWVELVPREMLPIKKSVLLVIMGAVISIL